MWATCRPRGSFSVFNISLEKAVSTSRGTESLPEGPAPVLVYFLPVPETRNVISVALLLSDITQAASYSEQEIVRSTQEKFNTLNLYRNGFISLFDGSRKAAGSIRETNWGATCHSSRTPR